MQTSYGNAIACQRVASMHVSAVLLPKDNNFPGAFLTGEENGTCQRRYLPTHNHCQQTNTFLFLATGKTTHMPKKWWARKSDITPTAPVFLFVRWLDCSLCLLAIFIFLFVGYFSVWQEQLPAKGCPACEVCSGQLSRPSSRSTGGSSLWLWDPAWNSHRYLHRLCFVTVIG